MRSSLEEDIVTIAPCSKDASATQKPMPEDPPITSTRRFRSLEVYLVESDILVGSAGSATRFVAMKNIRYCDLILHLVQGAAPFFIHGE